MNLVDMTDRFTICYLTTQKAWVLISNNENLKKMLTFFIAVCTARLQRKDCLHKTIHLNAVSAFKLAYIFPIV